MMMKVYKLTDENDQTYNGCQWGPGIEHTTNGKGQLCDEGWIHCYSHPLLAVMMNPIHGKFDLDTAHLWECEASGKIEEDNGLKFGATRVKTIKKVPLPKVTLEQRIKFAILSALEVCDEEKFVKWANKWLSGKNRTWTAAEAIAWNASRSAAGLGAAEAVAWNTARATTKATAARAVEAAAWAATEGDAGLDVAERAAAAWAAWATTWTTRAATQAEKLDLIKLAKKAVEVGK